MLEGYLILAFMSLLISIVVMADAWLGDNEDLRSQGARYVLLSPLWPLLVLWAVYKLWVIADFNFSRSKETNV